MSKKIKIVRKPKGAVVVTPDALVRFTLEGMLGQDRKRDIGHPMRGKREPLLFESHDADRTHAMEMEFARGNRVNWYVSVTKDWEGRGDSKYHKISTPDKLGEPVSGAGHEPSNTFRLRASDLGVGTWWIHAQMHRRDGASKKKRITQKIDTLDAVMTEGIKAARKEQDGSLRDPIAALWNARKYIAIVDALPEAPCPPEKRAKYDAHVKAMREFIVAMEKLVHNWQHHNSELYPLDATFLDKETQELKPLRVALIRQERYAPGFASTVLWSIFDWTDPSDPRLSGQHDGGLRGDDADKVLAALQRWNRASKYPPGHIRYVLPSGTNWQCAREDTFETGDPSNWEKVASFLETVANVATVVSAVAFVLVPGGQVLAMAMWTSRLAAAGAGLINAGVAEARGEDCPVDTLFVVGHLLGAAGKWAKGAELTFPKTARTVNTLVLYGEKTKGRIEGMLTTIEVAKEIDAVLQDSQLPLHEKIAKLGELVAKGTKAVVDVQRTYRDIETIRVEDKHKKTSEEYASDMLDASAKILIQGIHTDGDTAEDQTTGRVQVDAGHFKEPKPVVKRREYPPAIPTAERGILDAHDKVFADVARGKYYIFVRDGNPKGLKYVGTPLHEAKPETLKAKSADEGRHEGLACFDPSHAKTIRFLANLADHKPISTEEMLGGLSPRHAFSNPKTEYYTRYFFYKELIEKKGFVVRFDDEFVVERPSPKGGVRFHGDYDIHGIYHKDGKFIKDTRSIRKKLNTKMGGTFIAHVANDEVWENAQIMHGAHDEWELRNDDVAAGVNFGPQPPCTVYTPDGEKIYLGVVGEEHVAFLRSGVLDVPSLLKRNREKLKAFIVERGLEWQYTKFEKHKRGYKIDPKP